MYVTKYKGLDDFCSAFFHVEESPEAHVSNTCLCRQPCTRKIVWCFLVARHGNNCVMKRMYRNTINQGRTVHAECHFCNDLGVHRMIQRYKDLHLTLYLTYQPCHFSGGHRSPNCKSCTMRLLQFKAKMQVHIDIKVAYIYRAHWINMQQYEIQAHNARNGMRLLLWHGVPMTAFTLHDWQFIAREFQVKLPSAPLLSVRFSMDRFIDTYIRNICDDTMHNSSALHLHRIHRSMSRSKIQQIPAFGMSVPVL